MCVFLCVDDSDGLASCMCRVCMSPESYCEMINLENLFLSLCRIEQQVEPRCDNHGKEKAASQTGRVSSYKRLAKEVSGYCI